MVNQKGQAFSVFELMIAGVVAFAILMVLMQVIGGVLTGQEVEASKALSDAIKATSGSNQKVVGNFVIKKDESVTNVALAALTDYDPEQIVFEQGNTSDTEIVVSNDDFTRSMKYVGSHNSGTFSAIVVCMPNMDYMADIMNDFEEDSYDVGEYNDNCPEGMVCCAVIARKRK